MRILLLCGFFLLFYELLSFDCTNKHGSLICIEKDLITFPKPTYVSKDVIIMDLSKNNIRILYEDALEYFENLSNLTLDSNKIWKITNNAFKNQKKLKYLSLRNNALIISNNTFLSNVFKYLVRLEHLDISNNPLGIIPDRFFVDLRNLKELYLEEMVKEIRIQKGALSKLYNLKLLSLAKNNFISLPNHMQYEFKEMQLESLFLHDNPWACDCRMRWFKRWLITINENSENSYPSIENILKNVHPMLCKIPDFLNGKKFCDQTLNKFECKPKALQVGKILIANHLDNVTISCFFESDPKSYVRWFKNGILIQDHWERIKFLQSSGTNFMANLTIMSSKYGIDDGSYICETTNNIGSARTNYTLIIKIPSYNNHNLIQYKNQQTILLLIIVSTGIITLIILVGIVIYCFYGNNSNNEIKLKNGKKSDLLFINDKILITHNSDVISTSPLLKVIYKNERHNDSAKWSNDVIDCYNEEEKNKSDGLSYTSKLEINENPIVKNFMLSESFFSNHTSDSDNHSCQLSIHEDCPIHGNGSSYNCPIHGSESEINVDNSSYNWSYVFNNKNTVKNNFYSLKSDLNITNGCDTRYSTINFHLDNIKNSGFEKNDCTLSIDNISNHQLFTAD